MTLNDWADIAAILQAVLLPVSLLFVWYQLRQQTRLTRAANTQALVELSSPFNLQLIQDRKFAELWVHGSSLLQGMDEVDRYRFKSLLIWWLIFHENIYYQWTENLIDEPTYKAWNEDLKGFVKVMDLDKHWPDIRGFCQAGFVQHVDKLVQEAFGREERVTSHEAG